MIICDVKGKWDYSLNSTYKKLIDEFDPHKMSHNKPHLLYINKAIKRLISKRVKVHAKKKHSTKYWATFRSLHTKVTKAINHLYKHYINN